jgi:hypothetical protein
MVDEFVRTTTFEQFQARFVTLEKTVDQQGKALLEEVKGTRAELLKAIEDGFRRTNGSIAENREDIGDVEHTVQAINQDGCAKHGGKHLTESQRSCWYRDQRVQTMGAGGVIVAVWELVKWASANLPRIGQ